MRVKTPSQMSIRKTGITLWRGSGFLLRTLKKEQELFCPSLFLYAKINQIYMVISRIRSFHERYDVLKPVFLKKIRRNHA